MSREECLFGALAPELDGVAQSVNGLLMATDKRATEIDTL